MKKITILLLFIFTANQAFAVNCIRNLYETPAEDSTIQIIEEKKPSKPKRHFFKKKNKEEQVNEGIIEEPVRDGGFVFYPPLKN